MENAKILDGRVVAREILSDLEERVAERTESGLTRPKLAVVIVGDDAASQIYVKMKTKRCREIGMDSVLCAYPETITQEELLERIRALNADKSVHAILVQLPLPKQFDPIEIINAIDPHKDVDGLGVVNTGKLAMGDKSGIVPCTPAGCMRLIERTGADLKGMRALTVGASNLVGRPMARLLSERGATVTIATSSEKNLSELVASADLVVSATGCAELIKGASLKRGAIVIDVGIIRRPLENSTQDGKNYEIVGDVEFETARRRASYITPVPGGVGPMTVAMLMSNALKCARMQD